jgi:signal transduction histidine kinase
MSLGRFLWKSNRGLTSYPRVDQSRAEASTTLSKDDPRLPSNRGGLRIEATSWRFVLGTAVGVGLVSFLAAELMHYWLVPDLGRNHERLLAEALSAFIVSCLIAKLTYMSRQQHRLTIARMQVIAEMNHHIRNALAPISLSVDAIENQQLIQVISDGLDRIDWALREILPREVPIAEEQLYGLGFFKPEHRGENANYPPKGSVQ